MKKLIIILALLLFVSNGWTKWTSSTINANNQNHYYIDFETIKEENGYVYYWELVDFQKPDSNGNMSQKEYVKTNCKKSIATVVNLLLYKDSMGKGVVVEVKPVLVDESDWILANPGSVLEVQLTTVCSYVAYIRKSL